MHAPAARRVSCACACACACTCRSKSAMCMCMCMCMCLCMCMCMCCLSAHPSVRPSVRVSVCLPACLSPGQPGWPCLAGVPPGPGAAATRLPPPPLLSPQVGYVAHSIFHPPRNRARNRRKACTTLVKSCFGASKKLSNFKALCPEGLTSFRQEILQGTRKGLKTLVQPHFGAIGIQLGLEGGI